MYLDRYFYLARWGSPAHDEPVCPTGGLSFTPWAHARASSSGQCGRPPDAPPICGKGVCVGAKLTFS